MTDETFLDLDVAGATFASHHQGTSTWRLITIVIRLMVQTPSDRLCACATQWPSAEQGRVADTKLLVGCLLQTVACWPLAPVSVAEGKCCVPGLRDETRDACNGTITRYHDAALGHEAPRRDPLQSSAISAGGEACAVDGCGIC